MYVKVCGITHLDDALAAVAAGADALGFNFVPESKRHVDVASARAIIERVRGKVLSVAVVRDLTLEQCQLLALELGLDRLQLHGNEAPATVAALAPLGYKAVRIASAEDVAEARGFPGDRVLVDAKVEGQLGGTGVTLDWNLVEPLARERPLILAGGLTPENVERAVSVVQPWAVDTASGVDSSRDPRRKDHDKLRRFVEAARRSSRSAHPLAF